MAMRAATWVVALAASLPLWLVAFPPIQDLPAHAALIHALADPSSTPLYTTSGALVHSWIPYGIGAFLARFVGAYTAAKVLLGIAVVGFPLALAALSRRLGGSPLIVLAGIGLAWNLPVVLGFLPFVLSVSLALAWPALIDGVQGAWKRAILTSIGGILVFWTHSFGLGAFALLTLIMNPPTNRHGLISAAGLVPGFLLLALQTATSAGSGPLVVSFEDPSIRLLRLGASLGPAGSVPVAEIAATAMVLLAILFLAGSWKALPRRNRRILVVVAGALLLGLALPDHLESPRVVMLVSRFTPFLAAMLLAAVPVLPGIRTATVLALASVAFIAGATVLVAEGRRIGPAAEAVIAVDPGQRILGLTGHRSHPGSVMTSYTGIHLPFLYQAFGRGEVLAPFSHTDMPVHLHHDAAEIAGLSYSDAVAYARAGAGLCDAVLTDAGDMADFLDAAGLSALDQCGERLPDPWTCRRFQH
jgi:hypothetical protein